MKDVNVGGTNHNNLRYADDTALLAGNENELSELISKIKEVGKQFGMKINIKKTKAMVVSKKPNSTKINIAIYGEQIEQVTSYMYLGRLITEDGRPEKEIKRRIMIARTTFTNIWEHYYRCFKMWFIDIYYYTWLIKYVIALSC